MNGGENYKRVEKAIKYLIDNFRNQPSLEELSEVIGVSQSHLQRTFTEWAGVSPKQFLGYLTVEALKKEIITSRNITEASERVGLSSQSRGYDLMVNIEAVTPGEYKSLGKGLVIEYGFAETPFGQCFVAVTGRGVCDFQFTEDNESEIIDNFIKDWSLAQHKHDDNKAVEIVDIIFGTENKHPLNLFLRGTPFQIKVWKALIRIPYGGIVTYSDVTQLADCGKATRAVASAIAKNPVGVIIPCHRVIRNEGVIGQYRWKSERKASIICWEKSKISDK